MIIYIFPKAEDFLNWKYFHAFMGRKSLFLIITLINLKLATAYIDPGTGGMILSSSGSIIGLILAVIAGFFGKYLINPIKKLFSRNKK